MSDRESYLKRRDQLLMQDERIEELEARELGFIQSLREMEAENKALRENAEEDADTIIKLTKKYVALRKEAQAIVGFVDGPAETLRPDVFHLWLPFINRLRKAALLEEK